MPPDMESQGSERASVNQKGAALAKCALDSDLAAMELDERSSDW